MSDLERSWGAREQELVDRVAALKMDVAITKEMLCGAIQMLQNAADSLHEAVLYLDGHVWYDTFLAEEIIRKEIAGLRLATEDKP